MLVSKSPPFLEIPSHPSTKNFPITTFRFHWTSPRSQNVPNGTMNTCDVLLPTRCRYATRRKPHTPEHPNEFLKTFARQGRIVGSKQTNHPSFHRNDSSLANDGFRFYRLWSHSLNVPNGTVNYLDWLDCTAKLACWEGYYIRNFRGSGSATLCIQYGCTLAPIGKQHGCRMLKAHFLNHRQLLRYLLPTRTYPDFVV